jgi:hypothetical protein
VIDLASRTLTACKYDHNSAGARIDPQFGWRQKKKKT